MAEVNVLVEQPGPDEYLLRRRQSADEPVPQDSWYHAFGATLNLHCSEMCRSFCRGPWFGLSNSKLTAFLYCLCLPCIVVKDAVNEQRALFKQSGIVYLYIFLSITVVINIVVPLRAIEFPVTEDIQRYFVLSCILLAIAEMFYLWLVIRETVTYRDWNIRIGYPPDALMRVFYKGGLYLFGFLSFGYSLCNAIDSVNCHHRVTATVNIMKAIYIVLQMLFLSYFYKARIPDDTACIRIVMAHLLGTNLSLWFWTLCSEVQVDKPENCVSYPIPLKNTEKSFSPLFVEYLLIAASLFYQIWMDLLPTDNAERRQHCMTCTCQLDDGNDNEDQQRVFDGGVQALRAIVFHNLSLGIVVGCSFGVVFIILVITSTSTGEEHQIYHVAYAGGIITLYLTQMFACYIILLSVQSLAWDDERTSIDHEDALLYITLIGSLFWEGFHLYSLALVELNPAKETRPLADIKVRHLDMAADTLAMVQYLLQTITLVNLRRHRPTIGRNNTWISQCLLFLLATNFMLWIENSFFVEIVISTPGEKDTSIQEHLKPLGYILHPLNIFFRFHSAVCCLIAWSIFRN